MKIVCIVQARVGSTRLPGKVLKEMCGKTVLEHDVIRLKLIKNIDEIVIATTELDRDNKIVEECKKMNVKYFRGSEQNVLARYYYAAKENNADIVVRVTSDCPLIDPEVSSKIVEFYLENMDKYDYVSNTIDRTYPRGLDIEVFSFKALEKAFKEAIIERDKEHVTPYIWDNPDKFKLCQYRNDIDYSYLRWTLDTEEDYLLISTVYKELYGTKDILGFNNIIELFKKKPNIRQINENIEQKTI